MGKFMGRKNVTGSSVVDGLDQLVKEKTIFWECRKADGKRLSCLGCEK